MDLTRRDFLSMVGGLSILPFLPACSNSGQNSKSKSPPASNVPVTSGTTSINQVLQQGNPSASIQTEQRSMGFFVRTVNGTGNEQIEVTNGGGFVPISGSVLSNGDSFSGTASHRLNGRGIVPLSYRFRNGALIISANANVA